MDTFVIEGGARLSGTLQVDGSKNAALPLMAASLLGDEELVLRNVPDLSDVRSMKTLLGQLGVQQVDDPDGTWRTQVVDPTLCHAKYDVVSTMRASICVLGPLVARRHYARVSMPGGVPSGTGRSTCIFAGSKHWVPESASRMATSSPKRIV